MAEPQEARACANAAQAAEWDGPAGAHRTRHAAVFDAETRPHNERFRAAADVAPRDRVLDIGCGTGQTTRDAARAAVAGSALGIDLSAQMLDHARSLSREEGLANVSFLQARDRNEWTTAIREALAGNNPVPPPPTDGPHPFSLADPAVAEGMLAAAGF